MRTAVPISLLAGLFSVLPAAAATCPGTPVLQDSFTSANPALNLAPYASATVTIQGGKAEISVTKAQFARVEIYSGLRYADANVCVTVATPATDTAQKQDAGIVFWADGTAGQYTFEITPEGMFSIAQLSNGKWSYPVHMTASPAIVQGTGKSNTLRVLTKGSTATLFINDQKVGAFDGTPPAGGGMVGFVADSSDQLTAPSRSTSQISRLRYRSSPRKEKLNAPSIGNRFPRLLVLSFSRRGSHLPRNRRLAGLIHFPKPCHGPGCHSPVQNRYPGRQSRGFPLSAGICTC